LLTAQQLLPPPPGPKFLEDEKNATSVASLFLEFSHVGLKRKVFSMWLCFASAMLALKEEAF
jgi:hypothetical protein